MAIDCFKGFGFKRVTSYTSNPGVLCKALDESKFSYTSIGTMDQISAKELSSDERLTADFSSYFKLPSIDTYAKVMQVVNGSPDAMEWYKEWKRRESIASSLPGFLDKGDKDQLNKWSSASSEQTTLANKEKGWNKRVGDKAAELKNLVQEVAKEKKDSYAALSLVTLCNMVNQTHLELNDQAKLANIADQKQRKDEAKKLVTALQRRLFTAGNVDDVRKLFK